MISGELLRAGEVARRVAEADARRFLRAVFGVEEGQQHFVPRIRVDLLYVVEDDPQEGQGVGLEPEDDEGRRFGDDTGGDLSAVVYVPVEVRQDHFTRLLDAGEDLRVAGTIRFHRPEPTRGAA